MLQRISNTIGSLPVASIGCAAAGLYIGRKWCVAAAYKVGSIGANLIASKKGSEWNQTSGEYFKIAKKEGIRDLTAAAGFIALGLATSSAQEKSLPKEEKSSSVLNYVWPVVGGLTCFTLGGYKMGTQLHNRIGNEVSNGRLLSMIFARSLENF